MIVHQRRCPRCEIQHTVDMGTWGYFCFNCKLRFGHLAAGVAAVLPTFEVTRYLFTPVERARLEAYRNATLAGVYSDWVGTSGISHTREC